MKMLIAALALTAALPVVAQAQTPSSDCCAKMKAEGKECCCKDMDKHGDHAKHDMKEAPKK